MAQVTSLYYDTEVHLALTQVYILDIDIPTIGETPSLGIMEYQLRVPLKPLNTIECCDVRGTLIYAPMMPRDASFSASCTSAPGWFSSLRLKVQ